jgi:hypothetical protein
MKDHYDLLPYAVFLRWSDALRHMPLLSVVQSAQRNRLPITGQPRLTGRRSINGPRLPEPLLLQAGDLASVTAEVRNFVMPPARAARRGTLFLLNWNAGGPWRDAGSRT